MTTPTPANPTQASPAPAGPLLLRWRASEPVRLYAYSILSAVLLALAVVGALTGEWSSALTGVAAAVLGVVPGAEAARASVWSPQGLTQALLRSRGSWSDAA